jgi:XRE family aerobic/anaerobic benzoate catabolism transcriptional regulator
MRSTTPTRAESRGRLLHRPASNSEGDFLSALGQRVRLLRNHRGMTRKMVAEEADVSERHLAQLEAGEGNVSIVLLRRIAAAVSASLEELFVQDAANPAEKKLIQRFLERIPPNRLEEVLDRLMREIGPESQLRRGRIAMIGLRGAGKSTLGAKLAEDLCVPFIELDREIEKDTGIPLGEIFSLYGQSGYRAMERRTLERVIREQQRAVISVGGGVVTERETYDYLLAHCYAVWVKAQPEEHMSRVMAQGDFRVMAGSDQAMEDLRRILQAREPLYREADLCVDTSGRTAAESFEKMKAMLKSDFQ